MNKASHALTKLAAAYNAAAADARREVQNMTLGEVTAALKANSVPHIADLAHLIALRNARTSIK